MHSGESGLTSATSVVAYRKSAWLARSLTKGIRTIVAVDALIFVIQDLLERRGYICSLHGANPEN